MTVIYCHFMLEASLQKIGLTLKETTVYLQLLEIGMQPASVLAKKMKIPRSTSQFILNCLVEKEFVTQSIVHGITYYEPKKPDSLKNVIESRKEKTLQDIERQQHQLEIIVPLLKQISNPEEFLPKVTFYEGLDEYDKSHQEFLKDIPEGAVIYSYTSPAPVEHPKMRKIIVDFMNTRVKNKVHTAVIAPFGKDAVKLQLTDEAYLRNTLMTYKNPEENMIAETMIYGNKVLDVSYSEKGVFSSLIINEDMAKMRKYIFDLAWKQAERDNATLQKTPEYTFLRNTFKNIDQY